MKKAIIVSMLSIMFIGCKSVSNPSSVSSITIDTLLIDKFSIRAIAIDNGKVYYAANKNKVGYVDFIASKVVQKTCEKDTLVFEFRSLALVNNDVLVASIGNPAVFFKMPKSFNADDNPRLVYEEKHEKVFYDSMQFWNDREGIAIGDPIENCFCILITRDGGETWRKIPCTNVPKLVDGEAAFAASNTNIVIKGNNTWLVSGGKKARVFYSPDKGKTWTVYDTPIVQGETMTGIFTADFYNEKIGFVAGGNYDKLKQNFQNKALTLDGGKTWKLVGENSGFGFASCIQFVPNSNGNELVCVGATGIYYSNDKGTTWKQISSDNSLYTIRFVDENTAIAAGKDKIIRIKFQR
ncbi:MAG: oxidoreductase [Bacteroidota bacterium]